MATVRIGTRKSPLALAQAEWVAGLLRNRDMAVELIGIVTEGDRGLLRDKGMFVKALDEALLAGRIDLAVHSAKDVPVEIAPGLIVAAVPAREDAGDLLVSRTGADLKALPAGGRVGTASLRRSAQLLYLRPDLEIVEIRGNVETRLGKILGDPSVCDAVVVAAAGINRLGGAARVIESRGLKYARIPTADFLPAPGQGALMLVSRTADAPAFSELTDAPTATALRAERALVKALGADCRWPVAAWAQAGVGDADPAGGGAIEAAMYSVEGKFRVRAGLSGRDPEATAQELAAHLLEKGGQKILEWNRTHCARA